MPARADIVELNLFSLGCPTAFDHNSPSWQTNFDLGVTFTQISHVYIDWSGEIMGRLVLAWHTPPAYPSNEEIEAALGHYPSWRYTTALGGKTTYPESEVFDRLSEFVNGSMSWSELFDGQGTITIEYPELLSVPEISVIEYGFINLTSATLIVDGTIVPEPATIVLFVTGIIGLRTRKRKK